MQVDRAQGCLLGQLAGDALGSLGEFQTPEEIRRDYPDGVRELSRMAAPGILLRGSQQMTQKWRYCWPGC